MIKLEPNTFYADLLPIDNPRTKILSPEDIRQQQITDVLKSSLLPKNSPNVISQSVTALNLRSLLQIYSPSPNLQTGIWALGNNFGNAYLQSPRAYKLTNVNDINLRINISFNQIFPFGSAPTPDGDYSVVYYVVIADQPQGLESTNNWYVVVPFTFNYDNSEQRFYFDTPIQNFRLKDTITRTSITLFGTDYPDFRVNPTKITEAQYNKLATEDVTVNIGGGFDLGQTDPTTFPNSTPNTPLSTNNQAHFLYFLYGNSPAIDDVSFFIINPVAVFTYSGLFADYLPL